MSPSMRIEFSVQM